MANWHWESFEEIVTPEMFVVTNPGPLDSPIKSFSIRREKDLDLVLETTVIGPVTKSSIPVRPAGTVWQPDDKVEFVSLSGITCVAHGVYVYSTKSNSRRDGPSDTTQTSNCRCITMDYKSEAASAYTIEWLENVRVSSHVWIGSSIKDEKDIVETRVIGSEPDAIKLSDESRPFSSSSLALKLNIGEHVLYLCGADKETQSQQSKPGYIIYVGNPVEDIRLKIRNVLSFCLGYHLEYLGFIVLDEKSDMISMTAVTALEIGARALEMHSPMPAPLGERFQQEVNQSNLSKMASAIYAKYDELKFGSLSWAYWHAICAPAHMAAAHFGATIEAIQRAYRESHPEKFTAKLIDQKSKWNEIRAGLEKVIKDSRLPADRAEIFINKINNLNEMTSRMVSDKVMAEIGISLNGVETDAWKRRNTAAHGGEISQESMLRNIRETKLLRLIFHRILLKLTGASDTYNDDFTIGHPVRPLSESVPDS
jgi:hypothetical protein